MLLIFQRRIERNGFNANQVAVATPVTPVVALVENDTRMNSTRAAKKSYLCAMKMETNPWKPCEKKCECKAVGSCIPISTNESQVKHQKHLCFLFSFLLRIWKPLWNMETVTSVRLIIKINCFHAGLMAKDIKLKRRTIRIRPGLIG